MAGDGTELLTFLTSRYRQARQVTEDLRSRLDDLETTTGWTESPGSDRSLTKERVRLSIERSTIASAERLRALELVMSSCVPDVLASLRRAAHTPVPPEPVATEPVTAELAWPPVAEPPQPVFDEAAQYADLVEPFGGAAAPEAAPESPPPDEPASSDDPVRGAWGAPPGGET